MDDIYQSLLDASFHFVSYRPRSEKEICDFLLKKLQKRKISDQGLVDRALTRLRELSYVDDVKFVSWWIDQRQTHKPKGVRIIKQELLVKGISRDLIDEGIKRCQFPSQDELARRAIARKLSLWQKLPKLEQKKKLYGFLGRRGFDAEIMSRVIDEVVHGEVK